MAVMKHRSPMKRGSCLCAPMLELAERELTCLESRVPIKRSYNRVAGRITIRRRSFERSCSMASSSSASVILCTRNRAASLGETLRALGELEVPAEADLEIVVVDNGSSDGTPAVVRDFAVRSATRVRYIHEPRPGLSAARNRGIAAARGALLLFTDDDCLPAPGWAAAALRALRSGPCQVLGGRVELHDPSAAPVTIRTSQVAETLTSPCALDGFLHGCNMAFGRTVIEAVGPFDMRFGAGGRLVSAEDTDLVYRALKAGIKVSYDPSLVVFHDHGRSVPDQVDKLMRGYKLGMGGLAMKHLLGGDIGPAKSCYWNLRSALRDYAEKKVGLAHLRTESHLLLGALKFAIGAALDRAKPVLGRFRPAGHGVSCPDQLGSAAAE